MVLAMRSEKLTMPRWIMPIQEEDEPAATFGETLHNLRIARGWSQEYVAAAIGVRQGKISAYEKDKVQDPPRMTVVALEDLFGLERGTLVALLWGQQAREEIRRLFARSRIFAIRADSPPVVQELIEEIATLGDSDMAEAMAEEALEEWRRIWRARSRVRGQKPTPFPRPQED